MTKLLRNLQPTPNARRAIASIIRSDVTQTTSLAVKERFDGLEERCRILKNDELADAIALRYDELHTWTSKWKPEVLNLLLQLSDSPVEKTRIEYLALLGEHNEEPPLTWADILRDDPLDNSDGIWDNVDFGEASSESLDGSLYEENVDRDSVVRIQSSDDEVRHNDAEPYELAPDVETYKKMMDSKASTHKDLSTTGSSTSTRLIRDAINMLQGLPTISFTLVDDRICHKPGLILEGLTAQSTKDSLDTLGDFGTKISELRKWAYKAEHKPVLQTLQSAVAGSLYEMDKQFSALETRILEASYPAVTLTSFISELDNLTKLTILLHQVISLQKDTTQDKSIPILNTLFNLACERQALGDLQGYEQAARIFFKCFQTYLKPITVWIETGTLDTSGDMFFVMRSTRDIPSSSLWSGQYHLLEDMLGRPYVPGFLIPYVPRIFASGKAVNFLLALGEKTPVEDQPGWASLSFENVCGSDIDTMSAFKDLFATSFERWINEKCSLSSAQLLDKLSSKFKLWETLEAIEHIYFGRNGALYQQISDALFERIDRGRKWQDRFALTDLFRDKLASVNSIAPGQLSVRIAPTPISQQAKPRSVLKLTCLSIRYELPWQLATIIKPESFSIYQRIAVLLLQLLRARSTLDRQSIKASVRIQRSERRSVLSIQHRLRWFVETMQNYLLKEVLAPTMKAFRHKMNEVKDLDAMIAVHAEFLIDLQHACMLTDQQSSIYQALVSILDVVIAFSDSNSWDRQNRFPIDHRPLQIDHSDSSEGDGEDKEQAHSAANPRESRSPRNSIHAQLPSLSAAFDRLLNFVFTGARDSSRTTRDSKLQVLVDDLKFGINET